MQLGKHTFSIQPRSREMQHATLLSPIVFALANRCKNGNGALTRSKREKEGRFSRSTRGGFVYIMPCAFCCAASGCKPFSSRANNNAVRALPPPHPRPACATCCSTSKERAAFMSRRRFPVRINIFATTHTHMRLGLWYCSTRAPWYARRGSISSSRGEKQYALWPQTLLISFRPWRATPAAHAAHIFFTQYSLGKRCVLRSPLPKSYPEPPSPFDAVTIKCNALQNNYGASCVFIL